MISTDNGITWEQFCDFWGEDEPVKEILITSVGWIFASGKNDNVNGIYLSEDNGTTWKKVFNERANAIAEDENGFIYLGCPSGLYRILYSDLPVELVTFTTHVEGNDVTLNWATKTETNNSGFEIERIFLEYKYTDNQWETLDFVDGKGTIIGPNTYSFFDKNLQSGKYKYRLKQIDFDGSFEYSKEIEVEINAPTQFVLEQNYPNPFNPSTTISYQLPERGKVSLIVYDILGKEIVSLVNEYKTAGNYDVKFNTSTLPSGVYIYSLRLHDYSSVKKMTVIK
ncbi:MAG: T9SS type A sorting domain-containing protein [Melioribacteraceae bacterium]|nr:T9SS type A sorting domain-containing protein [Melioribacteraceae bacterium]